MQQLSMTVNGRRVTAEVDERMLLLEFIRDVANLTGTKNGCLEARCGCCTVHVDGRTVKSCNALALQFPGADVRTVESLAREPATQTEDGAAAAPAGSAGLGSTARLSSLQQAFHEHGALQCGYCTPGMLMTLTDFLERNPEPTENDVRRGIAGNLCRCTGYQKIVDATLACAASLRDEAAAP
jgi:carbon-monoxide dehydrogenase small subunit